MTIEEIKSLIEQINKSELTKFVYEKDGEKLVLSKKQEVAAQPPVTIMPSMGMMPQGMGGFAGAMPQGMAGGAAPAADAAEKSGYPACDLGGCDRSDPAVCRGTLSFGCDHRFSDRSAAQ